MAGRLPSFSSGSNLAIYIGNSLVAYGSNLSFVDDVSHAAVGGIGSYSYDALEPTQYAARGNFSLMRYSNLSRDAILSMPEAIRGAAPARSNSVGSGRDGNSLLAPESFNPTQLVGSQSFDIKVYERKNDGTVGDVIYTIRDCRLTGYSIGFAPGSLVSENISFICILVEDAVVAAQVGG